LRGEGTFILCEIESEQLEINIENKSLGFNFNGAAIEGNDRERKWLKREH
jgi:hypothetical protein